MPANMKNAIIAIEDNNFYEHGGVDFLGIVRAGVANLWRSRVARRVDHHDAGGTDLFADAQKTYSRKLQEIMLAYRIEKELGKDKILELYMNQIYLGERAYGFGSAARIYFGKPIQNLSIAEAAMLAGLPKAPASANPVVNPKRATERQQYIIKRMHDLKLYQRCAIRTGQERKTERADRRQRLPHACRIRCRKRAAVHVRAIQGRHLHQGLHGLHDHQ
jgi:penicillin-binding protein 1A